MRYKKVLALCLSVGMIMSLVACGNQENAKDSSKESSVVEESADNVESSTSTEVVEESDSIVFPLTEKVTFTMMNRYDGENLLADMPVLQKLSEDTNVYFEYIEYPKAEMTEKFNLLFSSGDYGDLLFKTTSYMDYTSLGQEGYLIPLEDLIREYAPNLTALLDERDAWSTLAASDGHIYDIPQITPATVIPMWYNTAWMEKVGISEAPANMDELTEMLRAWKGADLNENGDPNDEIPLLLSTHNNCNWTSLQRYMTDHYRTENTNDELVVLMAEGEFEGEYVYYPRTEEFKEHLLKYLITWYDEGLVNQDMFTIGYDETANIGASSNIYGMHFSAGALVPEANEIDYHFFKPFEKGYLPVGKGLTRGVMSITDKCENPEILMAWIDQFYAEEGGRFFMMGLEGVDYEITDDGYWKKISDQQTVYKAGNAPCYVPADGLYYKNGNLGELGFAEEEYVQIPAEYGTMALEYKFNEEQDTRIADLQQNINGYMRNYIAELIVGEKSLEDTWDEYQEKLLEMGVEELESLYKEGFEAAK